MILADTSVWVDHLRRRNAALSRLLLQGEVCAHPFIVGEIALGSLADRPTVLALLSGLPQAVVAHPEEALRFITRHQLFARGVGYVDTHLLVSLRLTPNLKLWTRDRRLLQAAESLVLPLQTDAP